MLILLLAILIILLLLLSLCAGSMLFHLCSSLRQVRAPFVPAPRRMIRALCPLVSLDQASVVYDLGCGDGRILRSLRRRFPAARYVGIENDLFPYLLARLASWKLASDRLMLKRKNFFLEDVSPATHIILYLFPEVMDQLLPKLERELKAGTLLFSLDFQFAGKNPERVIKTPELKGRRISIYRF